MSDEHITPMPTITEDPWIAEHQWANRYEDAHPIDDDIVQEICDSKAGPILMHGDLAVIQAVAIREILPYNCDDETWIERQETDSERDDDDVHYYTAVSASFYDLASFAWQRYDARIEVEDIAEIAHAHTQQYLRDVHGYSFDSSEKEPSDSQRSSEYEGDFGGTKATGGPWEPTLCNAQNDDHSLRDAEPEDAHYAYTDARGLVIQEGTHPDES